MPPLGLIFREPAAAALRRDEGRKEMERWQEEILQLPSHRARSGYHFSSRETESLSSALRQQQPAAGSPQLQCCCKRCKPSGTAGTVGTVRYVQQKEAQQKKPRLQVAGCRCMEPWSHEGCDPAHEANGSIGERGEKHRRGPTTPISRHHGKRG